MNENDISLKHIITAVIAIILGLSIAFMWLNHRAEDLLNRLEVGDKVVVESDICTVLKIKKAISRHTHCAYRSRPRQVEIIHIPAKY